MIKIEVTGNSIAEVADKMLAIGANLRGSAIVEGAAAAVAMLKARANPVMPEVAEATFAPSADVPLEINPVALARPEVAEAAAAPEPTPTDTPAAGTPEAMTIGTTTETVAAGTKSDAPSAPEVSAETVKALVLRVVAVKGRDAVVEVLGRFGVTKASDVPADVIGELVKALEDEI